MGDFAVGTKLERDFSNTIASRQMVATHHRPSPSGGMDAAISLAISGLMVWSGVR